MNNNKIVLKELGYELLERKYGGGWKIIDKNSDKLFVHTKGMVGFYNIDNSLLFYNDIDYNQKKDFLYYLDNWNHKRTFAQSPVQAARYVWLKRQVPINI